MGGQWRALVLGAGVAEGRKVYALKEPFTSAKQDRRNSDVYLVDQALAKILLNGIDTATNANILGSSRFARLRQGGGNAFSDEMEACSAIHDQRRMGVMGQHEHRDVINRIFAPPTAPALIGPGPANRPEHIPAKNPCPDVLKTPSGKVIINACFSAIVAEQGRLKRSGGQGTNAIKLSEPVIIQSCRSTFKYLDIS